MLKRLVFLILLVPLVGLFIGCSPRPPSADVIAVVQKNLPDYLQVTSVDTECVARPGEAGTFDLQGKATVTAKENLYSSPGTDEIKPVDDITNDYAKYTEWLNDRLKTPSANIIGKDLPDELPAADFVHLDTKAGDSLTGTCHLTAIQQGDKWKIDFTKIDWDNAPTDPISKFKPGSVAINTPDGAAKIEKMKGQLDVLHEFQRNSEIRVKEANRVFSIDISQWIKSGKTYSGLYQDTAFNRPRQEKIQIHFSHYEPDTMTFQGEVTFLTVHNAVMSFDGNIRDSMLNLSDMKVIKDPDELTPDDHWTLRLDDKGNLIGEYPGGPITIYGSQPSTSSP